jgi:hypothetical protein
MIIKREIKSIPSSELKEWLLVKHYAHRKPRIQYSFGLYLNGFLEGVITFGYPATPFISRGICGKEYEENVLELSRLVINSGVPKNSASFLIANSIKLLPEKFKIIISYADSSLHHIGYVYQATNFIYTGLTIPMKEWKMEGTNLHSQNVCKSLDLESRKKNDKFKQVYRPQKHRYLLFRGNKKEKEILKKNLKYSIKSYPKDKPEKYNSPDVKHLQQLLQW